MHSKLAIQKYQNKIDLCKGMSAQKRLLAFYNYSQLIAKIYQAGIAFREKNNRKKILKTGREKMKTAAPGQSPLLLLDIIEILREFKIPYAVIGALAASFYGVVCASLDCDALISIKSNEEINKDWIDKLLKKRYKVNHRRGDFNDPLKGLIHIQDRYHNSVDLLTGIRGMPEDILSRTINVPFLNSNINIVGLEDFIAMKVFAGSSKDIEDAKGALKISSTKINIALLKKIKENSHLTSALDLRP